MLVRLFARWLKGARTKAASSESKKNPPSRNLNNISVSNILAFEDQHRCQQEAEDICAAGSGVVIKVRPGHLGFQNIAPEFHVGGKEEGPKVYKEFDAADDIEHEINGERRSHRGYRIIEQDRQQHSNRGNYQQRPGARKACVKETPQRIVAEYLARGVNQI